MKAGERLLLLACALAAVLALPGAASAKPGYEVRPGSTELNISLGNKAGYSVSVSATDEQRVQLAVEEGIFAATSYSAKGRVSSKRIEAGLGALGQIDVRVRLATNRSKRSKRSREGNRRCKGRPPLYLPGTYRGAIEFSGEGDVPAVSSKRGRLLFVRRYRQVCKRPSQTKQDGQKRPPSVEVGALQARAKGEGRTTLFEAFSVAPIRDPALSIGIGFGATYERREGVRIARTAFELFGLGIVMSKRGENPETVKVKMEKPFSGRARYSRSPGSPASWTGNLSVKLPGADPTPLTGPGFSTALCRGVSLPKVERCLYGSGSHSQPLALARLSSLR